MSAERPGGAAPVGRWLVRLGLATAITAGPAWADGAPPPPPPPAAPRLSDLPDLPDVLDNPLDVPFVGAAQAVPPAPPTVVGVGGDALCQPDAATAASPLTLAQAVQLALCNNAQLRAAWAAVRVQASAVGESRAAYLPRLNASASWLNTRTAYPDLDVPADTQRGSSRQIGLTWRLFDFGAREAGLDAAHRVLDAAIASRDAALQKLLSDLTGAYFDAVTAQAVRQAREEATQLAQHTLDAAARREALGVAAGIDVLQSRVALGKAQLSAQRAMGDERKALAQLAFLLGWGGSRPVAALPRLPALAQLGGVLDAPEAPNLEDLQHWLDETQARHPTIASARAQLEAARARVTAARAEGLPTLDVSYNQYGNGYPSQGLSSQRTRVTNYGLTLSLPLFEGFARTYKVRGAQAQVEQNEAGLRHTLQQVSIEVIRAHADAASALGNLAASAGLLDAAEQAQRSAERRYDKGVGDIAELLTQQGALVEARQERIRCLADWQAARLRLLAAAGVLVVVDVGEAPPSRP